VDLLPDRAAGTLATWLKEHPGAEVISRDRATGYAEGARQGAPDAVQVADRFHLLKNLTDALGEVLGREHAALRKAAQVPAPDPAAAGCLCEAEAIASAAATTDEEPTVPAPPPKVPDRRSRREREQSAHSRERRLARYEETLLRREEGLSARQIARRLGISATTVNKDLAAGAFPERQPAVPKRSPVEPYAAYLRQRWEEGCHNAKQLWRELREQGFTGGFVSVWRFTRSWRASPAPGRCSGAPPRDVSVPAQPAPRAVVWWLLLPKKRTEAQTAFVERLEQENPKIRLAHELVTEFFGLVRERKSEGLAAWIARAEASAMPELIGFCRGVRRDWEAVVAGLTLKWSNGPVEGQVNRLKLIKRQMYGRASFALLRARVLRLG
jgi:transposase